MDEVIIVRDDENESRSDTVHREEGVEVPFERIPPDALRNLISEFVTRDWEEFGSSATSLDVKIEQVMVQLQRRTAKIVYDLRSESCNIVSNND